MSNHNIWVICQHCQHEFDSHLHGTVCPNCGNLKKLKQITGKIITVILIVTLIILAFTSCAANQYATRQRRNKIAQQAIQYEHCISANADWTRAFRNWNKRPQANRPFNFLLR